MTYECTPGFSCSPSYSITIRVEIENRIGMFARIATAISSAGGDLGSVDIVRVERGKIIRDITVNARNEEHEKAIVKAIKTVAGVKCRWRGPRARISVVPSPYEVSIGRPGHLRLHDIPLIEVVTDPLAGAASGVKRVFDLVVAAPLFVL